MDGGGSRPRPGAWPSPRRQRGDTRRAVDLAEPVAVRIGGEPVVLQPGQRAQPRADEDVGVRRAAPGAGLERKAGRKCRREDDPRVAAAGDGHRVRPARPPRQARRQGDERVRGLRDIELPSDAGHDLRQREQLLSRILSAGRDTAQDAALDAADRAPHGMAAQ